jgi:hypothetical protein
MKATASSAAGTVGPDRPPTVPLPISAWEEETFIVLAGAGAAAVRRSRERLEWEDIEAVGAADDPTRFKIDIQTVETLGLCLEHTR